MTKTHGLYDKMNLFDKPSAEGNAVSLCRGEKSGNAKLNLSVKPNPMELAPIGEAEESGV